MSNSRRDRSGHGGFVDDGLTLDINRLLQRFDLLPGKQVAGTLRWVTEDGSFSAGYEASLLNPKRAWLRLSYTIADPPDARVTHHDYRIRLTTTRTHLGGLRWWFRCPETRLRTAKLYLPSTGFRFLSRRAYGGSHPRRRGLFAHIRDHLAWMPESGPGPAHGANPASPRIGLAGSAPSHVQRTRRIYAERQGRPMGRARRLVAQDGC